MGYLFYCNKGLFSRSHSIIFCKLVSLQKIFIIYTDIVHSDTNEKEVYFTFLIAEEALITILPPKEHKLFTTFFTVEGLRFDYKEYY